MKKILLSALVILSIFTGCSKDNLEVEQIDPNCWMFSVNYIRTTPGMKPKIEDAGKLYVWVDTEEQAKEKEYKLYHKRIYNEKNKDTLEVKYTLIGKHKLLEEEMIACWMLSSKDIIYTPNKEPMIIQNGAWISVATYTISRKEAEEKARKMYKKETDPKTSITTESIFTVEGMYAHPKDENW